jgi:hypothetical protein
MNKIRYFIVIPLFTGWMAGTTVLAQPAFRIEDRMNAEELRAAGLDGLDAGELDALNNWLQHNVILQDNDPGELAEQGAEPPAIPAAAPEVAGIPEAEPAPARRYGEKEEFQEVVSVIRGAFNGWDGNTVFRLENGQVYQQRRPGRWKTSLTDPEVRVTRGFLGMMELVVDGHSIGVKRLE